MNGDKTAKGAGQQKPHRVNNADGTPVEDSGSGEGYMTQEQWQRRDKTLGQVRVDEATGEPITEDDPTANDDQA